MKLDHTISNSNSVTFKWQNWNYILFQYHGWFVIEPNLIPRPSISTSKRSIDVFSSSHGTLDKKLIEIILRQRHQPLQCILYDDTYFFAVVQKTICLIASLRWQQDKEGDGMVVELWVLMAARVAPGKRHGGGRLFLFLTYPVRQSQWFNYICELWHCYEKIFANNKWSRIIRQELKVCKHYI